MIFPLAACKKNPGTETSSGISGTSSDIIGSIDESSTDGTQSDNNSSDTNSGQSSGNTQTPTVSVPTGGGNTSKDILSNVPASLRGTEITVYSWNEPGAVTTAETVIAKFTKETGIKVKWLVGTYTNYATEITSMVAAQQAPDVIRIKAYDPAILSLMGPLSQTNFDYSGSLWDQDVMKYYSVNGNPYAVNLKNSLINQPAVLMYNRDLISQFDLDDPYSLFKQDKWTWSKFVELCYDFCDAAGKGYTAWSPFNYNDYAYIQGEDFITLSGGKLVNNVGSKKFLKSLQTMADFYEDGITGKGYTQPPFTNGTMLFFSDGIIGARRTHFYFKNMKEGQKLGVVPFPKVDGQSEYYQWFTEYEAYGTVKGAKNPGAVPYFLSYYLNGDNYDKESFFYDPTVLDVYNWCMSQKNKSCVLGGYVHGSLEVVGIKSSQMATHIQSQTQKVQKTVDDTG